MMKIPTTQGPGPSGAPPPSEASMLMALATMKQQGSLDIRPDVAKQSQWPSGSDLGMVRSFDQMLKRGEITQDQYNKARSDPRQQMGGPQRPEELLNR